MSKQAVEGQARTTNDWFGRFAAVTSGWLGSKWGFCGAAFLVIAWATSGPLLHYSDEWQLVANTGTNVITFIMVFLIQNTQNRDARAMNLKLDELIRAIDQAGDDMIDIENLSDVELDELQAKYVKVKAACDARDARGRKSVPAS
jgi:low affinity Fe/Cu permease